MKSLAGEGGRHRWQQRNGVFSIAQARLLDRRAPSLRFTISPFQPQRHWDGKRRYDICTVGSRTARHRDAQDFGHSRPASRNCKANGNLARRASSLCSPPCCTEAEGGAVFRLAGTRLCRRWHQMGSRKQRGSESEVVDDAAFHGAFLLDEAEFMR